MSFILDALKKSESDRARQSGPALYEVKVPPPRHGLPLWALIVVGLLAVNLVIGVWMLVRHTPSAAAGVAPAAGAATTAASSALPSQPAGVATAAPAQSPPGQPVSPATQTVSAPLPPATAPAVPGSPATASAAARTNEPPPAGAAESANPEDYEPAGPAPRELEGPTSHVRRGTADGVPLYQELATQQGASLPQLRLDLHVYAAVPSQRFVMINMRKLREGDSTPEGARVEAITPDGAVLSFNGSRFLLTQ